MNERVICPSCAGDVDPDITCWVWNGHFYCSEMCCRKAALNG